GHHLPVQMPVHSFNLVGPQQGGGHLAQPDAIDPQSNHPEEVVHCCQRPNGGNNGAPILFYRPVVPPAPEQKPPRSDPRQLAASNGKDYNDREVLPDSTSN